MSTCTTTCCQAFALSCVLRRMIALPAWYKSGLSQMYHCAFLGYMRLMLCCCPSLRRFAVLSRNLSLTRETVYFVIPARPEGTLANAILRDEKRQILLRWVDFLLAPLQTESLCLCLTVFRLCLFACSKLSLLALEAGR